jgi:hypothetical protein
VPRKKKLHDINLAFFLADTNLAWSGLECAFVFPRWDKSLIGPYGISFRLVEMPSESYQALMRGLAYSSKNCKFFFLLI